MLLFCCVKSEKEGFEGLDGAKVYRGTAKGFLEDLAPDTVEGTF